ncbi:hypothetical protein NDU88_006002 [Pleurodeles waltl]|uniref:Uncharacterized protein n=1 Tax=Pleurodeles waltl TaxID=8319 RepID=A0AAV7MZ63_PLEWA|nr:hypothetical protein NDU88_006002 [Pleurodeles waltl]
MRNVGVGGGGPVGREGGASVAGRDPVDCGVTCDPVVPAGVGLALRTPLEEGGPRLSIEAYTAKGKQKLSDLKLDYNMLYLPRLRVMVAEKALIFSDPQKLQQFIAKREAKGQRRNAQAAEDSDAEKDMDAVE